MGSVASYLSSAMKATAPIVAIPVEGGRPFAVRRALLVNSLKGLRIKEAAIQMPLDSEAPYLHVIAEGKGVKSWRKFVPLRMEQHRKQEVYDWAELERKKRAKPAAPQGKYAKAIAKLEKQLSRINLRKPHFILIRESSCCGSGSHWAQWKREQGLRRQLQQLARKYDSRELYTQAAKLGVKVTTYSKLNTRQKDSLNISADPVAEYRKRFWEFCGLTSKPYGFEPRHYNEASWGPKHYAGWLACIHERNEVLSQIEGIRVIMQDAA